MKTIILSAGQGRRLLPLTADLPKCLLEFSGMSLLEWQMRSLAKAGVDEIVVVSGFESARVEAAIAEAEVDVRVRILHNPFYALADNLASCWTARHEMTGEFLILNGDTLFEPAVAERVLAGPATAPITVTIDRKPAYDPDDMKVSVQGDRLRAIGKTLPAETVHGESIGFLRFDAAGGALFVAAVEQALKTEAGLKLWYLSAVDRIAREEGTVGVRSIEGLDWGELDFPDDLVRNRAMTAAWTRRGLRF